jgi:AsmA protein
LTGALGLAIPGGTIDNRLLGSILGQMLSQINALDLVGRGGSSELRCFGTRLEIHQGVAAIRVLDLSSGLATMTGTGSINLGAETLNLLLRPEARIGGTTIVIPVRLEGPIRKPSARVNEVKSVEDNAATVAGAMIGNAPSLGAIGSLLGAGRFVGGGDMCPAALALARGQAAPAEAPPKGPIPGLPTPNLPIPGLQDPGKTLRNLLR